MPELDTYETNLGSGRIFIAPYALDEGVRLEIEKYDVEWIDTPLDFLGLNIQMECLLLDSRLPWLNINNLRMGTSQSYFRKIVLYNANSDDYEKVTDFHVCARDLSADLLEGILIGALYFRHGAANASSMGAVLGGQDMRRSAAVA